MDIQVIDAAELPDVDKPSGPKKKLITIFGTFAGSVISSIYIMVCYKKKFM